MAEWQPETMAYLKRYRECVQRIEVRQEEVQRLRQALQPGAMKISDGNGGGQRRDLGDRLALILELEERITDEIGELSAVRDSVLCAIEAVSDERFRVLLEKRYINGKTWEVIAAEMFCDPVTVWRWHGAALEMVVIPDAE